MTWPTIADDYDAWVKYPCVHSSHPSRAQTSTAVRPPVLPSACRQISTEELLQESSWNSTLQLFTTVCVESLNFPLLYTILTNTLR
jgi:hypothetical protein